MEDLQTVDEDGDCSSVESPPRVNGPQHERFFSDGVDKEEGKAAIDGDVSTGVAVDVDSTSTMPITPNTPVTFANNVLNNNSSGKSLDDFFRKRGAQVKYYRIIYRGVVALLSKPEAGSGKSGAYVSYGEIIASRKELDITLVESPTQKKQNSGIKSLHSPNRRSQRQGAYTNAASPKSSTSSSLPLAPSSSFIRQHKTNYQTSPQIMRRIIQVDEVLTGGYAIDASSAGTSHTHNTPKRKNHLKEGADTISANTAPSGPCTSPAHSDSNCSGDKLSVESKKESMRHHGFLFQSRKGVPIAESIPAPPLLCQAGTFYYRVTSLNPLPILAGPCADAPKTRAMALPGTVHEISLRMGSLDHGNANGIMNSGMEDGIVYLRLSHRKGWIADRRFVTTLLHGRNIFRGHNNRFISDESGGTATSVEYVMKEVSDYVDVSCFGVRDDMSLGGTSISSASISTPANIIRTRRRPVRRRTDEAVGMVVQQHKSKSSRGKNGHSSKQRHQGGSPLSHVSVISESKIRHPIAQSDANEGASGDAIDSIRMTNHNSTDSRIKPDVYLMRVTAPKGLKILDAPHFQVNSLIRGHSSQQGTSRKKLDQYLNKTSPSKAASNPSSIFHTMSGSLQTDNTSLKPRKNYSWELDSSGKYRILPRGALFETSKRMEKAGNYAPGSGLIKLADNTGWAIIPTREELVEQFQMHQADVGLGITEEEAARGFEEVGNAFTDSKRRRNDDNIFWVRVVQQTGVFVSCAPEPDGGLHNGSSYFSRQGQVVEPSSTNVRQQDHDAVSSVSSVFFDAFRSSKKNEARMDSLSVSTAGGANDYRKSKFQIPKSSGGPVIPCGACVKVNRWASSSCQRESQSFVRLSGSLGGWIPRMIHGVPYSVDIKHPDGRCGSFWFRVQPEDGVKVRIGPSERSPAIKSENGHFQFECGEYLRASEILTIHGHADIEDSDVAGMKVEHPSESFAKLYRNSSKRNEHSKEASSAKKRSLDHLTKPGEWVRVHCNGHLYLEECVNPPSIERHHDGWRYEVATLSGVEIRRGPSFSSKPTNFILQHSASILVNEKVTASGDSLTWLRLKDGRGWVHNIGEQSEIIMKSYASKKETKPSVNKLISRLGLR